VKHALILNRKRKIRKEKRQLRMLSSVFLLRLQHYGLF
jgi:hypothetical protein